MYFDKIFPKLFSFELKMVIATFRFLSAHYGDIDITNHMKIFNIFSPDLTIGEIVSENFVALKPLRMVFETDLDQTFGTSSYLFPNYMMNCRKIRRDGHLTKRYEIEARYENTNKKLISIPPPNFFPQGSDQ